MTTPLLILDKLQKAYSTNNFSLGPIDLTMFEGECVGLMGENGAGKTTLFQLITGNLKPSGGSIKLGEHPLTPDAFYLKRSIGYLPQNLELPPWVSGREILSYAIHLYQLDRPKELCEQTLKYWDSSTFADKPLAACSHGMKKRIALGLATLHDPKLLILDEPFSGLDLYHIKALHQLIQQRTQNKRTTILSTHIAPYTAKLCKRLLTLRSGSMTVQATWETADYLGKIEFIESLFFNQGEPTC